MGEKEGEVGEGTRFDEEGEFSWVVGRGGCGIGGGKGDGYAGFGGIEVRGGLEEFP